MDEDTSRRTASAQPGRPRWQITLFQLLFGLMAVSLGGLISAEPSLSLDRHDDGRLESRYALNAYGRFPTMTASVDDLVSYEVTQGELSGLSGRGSSGVPWNPTRSTLHMVGRNGSRFAVGQTWSLSDLDRMIAGEGSPSHHERIVAGSARRYGGLALGAFGLLLLAGAIWNIVLMGTGIGSPTATSDPV